MPKKNTSLFSDEQFSDFYRLHRPQVVRYVTRRLRWDIDDVVEEAFVTAWRKRALIPQATSDQIVWLYAIARRVIANKVRWRARLDLFKRAHEPLIVTSTNGDSEGLTALLVHSAIRRMRPQDREVLLLVEWDGCTIDEAASVLGITSSAAGKRIGAARIAFAEQYDKLKL
jgi:RNA polymerase sigma-70 factor (ECF subfamily)